MTKRLSAWMQELHATIGDPEVDEVVLIRLNAVGDGFYQPVLNSSLSDEMVADLLVSVAASVTSGECKKVTGHMEGSA